MNVLFRGEIDWPRGRRAFNGGPLAGGTLARLIYIDEAGTSAGEPVTVVAGVIAHPDHDWQTAFDYLEAVRQDVPAEIRRDMVFHATELFSSGKRWDRQKYDKSVRWPILERILAGARLCKLPVAIAWIKDDPNEVWPNQRVKMDTRHSVAFLECLKVANSMMHLLYPGEKATLTVEDKPEMKSMLMSIPRILRSGTVPQKFMGPHPFDKIIDMPNFTAKDGAPILQLADAAAFAIRRYLGGYSDGEWAAQHFTGCKDVSPILGIDGGLRGGSLGLDFARDGGLQGLNAMATKMDKEPPLN